MNSYSVEPNTKGSLGLKLGVLFFIQHLDLHLPGGQMVCFSLSRILIFMKTSQLQHCYLGLDPRLSVWIPGLKLVFAMLANLAFIFTYLNLVWFQITEKQRDRKYEREVKRHRHRGQNKKAVYI